MDIDYPDPTGMDALDQWLEELVDGLRYPSFDMETLQVSGHVMMNQGTIAGIEMTESDLNISPGGDINFVGTSYTITLDGSVTGESLYIEPDTSNAVEFAIGQTNYFKTIDINATEEVVITAWVDGNDKAVLQLQRQKTDVSQMILSLTESGAKSAINWVVPSTGDPYNAPGEDGSWLLGTSTYRWKALYCDEPLESYDTGWISRSDWTNVHLGNIVLDYDNLSGTFTVGETVTGGTTGDTGVIVSDTGSTLVLKDVTSGGIFQDDEEITGSESSATADVNEAAGSAKNQDQNVTHSLGANLSELLVKVLVSSDGTDNNSFEIHDSSVASGDGYIVYQVDTNNVQVQTGATSIRYLSAAGASTALDTEDWFYKVRLFRIG